MSHATSSPGMVGSLSMTGALTCYKLIDLKWQQQPPSHDHNLHNNMKNGRLNLKRHSCNLDIMYAANSAGRNGTYLSLL